MQVFFISFFLFVRVGIFYLSFLFKVGICIKWSDLEDWVCLVFNYYEWDNCVRQVVFLIQKFEI